MVFLGINLVTICALPAGETEQVAALVLHLSLDEGQGIDVRDRSTSKNDGTINGRPTWVPGKRGLALRFHGNETNAFIDVRPSESLEIQGAHTISFWLQWNGQGAPWSPLITKRPVDVTNPDHFSTWVSGEGKFEYRNDHGMPAADGLVGLDDQWHFLAVTHDGQKTLTFYIDGGMAGKKELAATVPNGGPLVVGSGRHLAGDFGAGAIDDIAIFSSCLTAEEIKQLMENGPRR